MLGLEADGFARVAGTGTGGTERTVVHLLRHGEVYNPEKILYGRLPGYHLSDLGHEMARIVADHLLAAGEDVFHLVSGEVPEPASLTPGAQPGPGGSVVYPGRQAGLDL